MKLSAYMNRIEKDSKYNKKIVDYVCMDSGFRAVTDFGEYIEGFVFDEEKQAIYLPHLTLTENMDVRDFHCQCAESRGFCIHKAGLVWGVNLMQQMECSNLNDALKCYCEENGLEYEVAE